MGLLDMAGLLGMETDEDRKRREAAGIEAPGLLARIGRGYMDMAEPVQQLYYDAQRPEQAGQFRRQRADDEALYKRGLWALHPEWSSADPVVAAGYSFPGVDPWRVLGRSAAVAPFLGGIPAAVGEVGRGQIWDSLTNGLLFLRERGLLK